MNNDEFVALLHTLNKDGNIDQILAAFTDEERFVDWAEDFLKKNPKVDLYYSVLSLNPSPGQSSVKRYSIPNPNRKSLIQTAIDELNSLSRMN